MRLTRGLTGLTVPEGRRALTIGAFDGLHLGHQALIARLAALARARGEGAWLVSFEPLPREFLQPSDPPARLTSLRERWRLLAAQPLETLCLLRFNDALRNLSPAAFAQALAGALRASAVVIGHDFRFGRRGEGDPEALRAAGARLGFDVEVVPPVALEGERVSSSAIRAALARGEFERAARALGRAWTMRGRVVPGQRLGRTLGFPTANLPIERRRAPVQGIFAVWVRGLGATALPGVASLGTRPAVQGTGPLLEVHLFDYAGELYGRELEVEFVAKLREEAHFDTLAALTAQMQRDALAARRILGT
ncbi:MAG: bifunctional riboflavin kinase/FAD synthetase [Gammaproteobacteria bacterium]|nr:bifunctional riboflavin kinase/FAD synthetase [Gammaproteobacteria bacterium]